MTTTGTGTGFDAAAWLARWDAQQEGYVVDRDAIFELMLDLVERVVGRPRRVLDLGCGPGSLTGRVARRFPDAEIVGVDADPVMLDLARRTLGDRVRWVRTDLADERWVDAVGVPDADAVVSSTALHWLPADRLAAFAGTLAGVLRPGGLFLNFDTLLADAEATPRLATAITDLRHDQRARRTDAPDFEDFGAWWSAAAREPGLAPAFADRVAADHVGHGGSSLAHWERTLGAAGFAEVATVTQMLDRRLLAAVR